MLTDLFSALDCNTINLSILLWLSPFILLSLLGMSFHQNNLMKTSQLSISGIHSEFRNDLVVLPSILFSLMMLLVIMNLIGLAPYTYGNTSGIWVAGSFALTIWLLVLVSGWVFKPDSSAAHLTPAGAPMALSPFLVLIETVSVLIRPLTLTVRLIANISAGHIILSLVANCLSSSSGFLTSFLLLLLNTVMMYLKCLFVLFSHTFFPY
uniref:ATP synthase subunit a n=1 Tax=Odontoglaja guamensis TaxID=259595 RepID=E6Y1B4_9GAST|nr:ATP synthase F0 subunit 6 [Odontoglaja guamensis]